MIDFINKIDDLNMVIFDLKSKINDPEVIKIFSLAVGYPTHEKLNKIFAEYKNDTNRQLLGLSLKNKLIGLIGFTIQGEWAVIHHIAVHQDYQKQGFGQKLVTVLQQKYNLNVMKAKTDIEAVHFYEKLDFICKEMEHHHGRYLCIWRKRKE